MKRDKIIYWVATGLLSAWMLLQGYMFTFNSGEVAELIESLGFPTSIIIPLGIAKILAVIAIISNLSPLLKKLAYLGLGIDFLVALVAHINAGDGQFGGSLAALILLWGSFFYYRRLTNSLST